MLGIFKKFWKTEESNVVTVPSPSPFAKPAAQPATRTAASPQRSPALPRPNLNAAPTVSVSAKASAAPLPSIPGSVTVTLGSIEPSLPEPLRHKISGALHELVPVPLNKVLPQLQRGAVSLTVKELRECAPELLASFQGHDEIPVNLPLGDIVRQIEPKLLPRRGSQKRIDVPKEVSEIFTQTSDGLTVLAKPPASAQQSPASPAAPRPKVTATATSASPVVATPTPVASAETIAPAKPEKICLSPQALAALAAAAPAKKTAAPAKAPAITIPTGQATAPIAAPQLPKLPSTAAAKKPAATASPAPSLPKPVTPAVTSTAAKSNATLAVPLQKLLPALPPEICKELGDVDVDSSSTALPMAQLEEMLKIGKVLFTWGDLANWLTPPLPRPPSQSASSLLIELPLKMIAPIFMAQHRAGSQKRADVGEGIPDLFQSGSEGAASVSTSKAAAPVEAAPTPAPAATKAPAPAPAKVAAAPTASKPAAPAKKTTKTPEPAQAAYPPIEALIGTAAAKFSPKEIVQNVSRLPGINGALLAMTDGLPVASVMPQNLKADTLAAFLPQMFGRMTQYTKELGLGALQSMTLNVEGGCWQVFKQPNIYFAVCGKPGEPVPFNLLAQIAAELSKETK